MSKPLRIFDKSMLDSAISESSAILVGDYPKLNGMIMIKYICKCLKECDKRFNNIIYYGGAYCKDCINKNRADKIRNTCKERYGVINPSQLQEVKDKKNDTYDKHFGCHPLQSKEIQEKKVKLHMDKYGCENPSQRQEIKDKIKDTFTEKYGGHPMFNDEIKLKVKETCVKKYGGAPMTNELIKQKFVNTFNDKYGCSYPMLSDLIKEKTKNTFFEKYGGYPGSNDNIKKKIKERCKEKYGTDSVFQSQIVKNKIRITCNNKYGTDNPMQNIDIMKKSQDNAKKYKKYTLPSGKIINIQGYEHFALDILFKTYTEEQVMTQRKDIPRIKYTLNNKIKYYFPDIYIPSENKIIEVKSTWTYKKDIDKNKIKSQFTIDSGYIFEFWIFDEKGRRIYANEDGSFAYQQELSCNA